MVIKQNKREIKDILKNTDWEKGRLSLNKFCAQFTEKVLLKCHYPERIF